MYEDKKLTILTEIFGNPSIVGNEYLFYCPKCNHHKKKLSVNLSKDKYKCWICDTAGSNLRLIKRYGNFQQHRIWSEMVGVIDLSDYDKIFADKEEKVEEEEKVELPKEFMSLCNHDNSLTSLAARRYLKDRGITKQDILMWKIGYCVSGEFAGRVVVPSFNNDGKVNYFVGRTYDNSFRKYMNPNVSKDIVFNELFVDWNSDVVIVEGIFDAIKAENAIPLLGSTIREGSKLFHTIVKNDSAIYVALDPDAEKKAEKLILELLDYDVEVYKINIPAGKDVGDMTKQEFKEHKKNAVQIKRNDYLLNKIFSL
jgi:DNA primase